VDGLDPVDAIRRIAELTFDHHQSHPDFIRLVSIENINRAEHMAKSPTLPGRNVSVVSLIEQILARGREQGRFVRAVDALDVHMLISSYCVFRVANRHTFKTIFGRDLTDPALRDRYRAMLGDLVVAYLTELDDDP
jgi:TetR/AcrR family transcriptional regulator